MRDFSDHIIIIQSDPKAPIKSAKLPRPSDIVPVEPSAAEVPEPPRDAVPDVVQPPDPVPPQSPEYTRPDSLRMSGATAPDGVPWIRVHVAGDEPTGLNPARSVWTRLGDWEGSGSAALQRLSVAHIYLPPDEAKKTVEQAWWVKEFPALALIEHPGWAGPYFALPSGEVFSPDAADAAVVLFEKHAVRCSAKGSIDAWLEGVARLAAGQSIITFALMIPFVAALLQLSPILFNPGFELTGPRRRGKSTLQQLVASIIGPAVEHHGRNYQLPANTTVNALEIATQDHRDLPMVIEEMGLFYAGESDKARANKMRELIMRMAEGGVKARQNEPVQTRARFAYLTSSNETLTSLFGEKLTWATSAAGDRLLTIPIAENRKLGIFDKLPRRCDSSKQAIRETVRLIAENHGVSMPVYLRQLVVERATGEDGLKHRIEASINRFREAVGIDDNAGPESSIADVFGLVYAAGLLAQAYGALPSKLNVLKAAITVHGLNRAISAQPPSFSERLRVLADRKGVIRVDARNLQEVSDEALAAAPAILRSDRAGKIEMLLTDDALARAFPMSGKFFKDPDVRAAMRTDKDGRKKVSESVRANPKQERLYAFAWAVLESNP